VAIKYLNTDLDLASMIDLAPLVSAFEAHGFCTLRLSRGDDGLWRATFEIERQYDAPEATIDDMLTVVEGLQTPLLTDWQTCTVRECNIGYACGAEPWAFTHSLSTALLSRLAAVRAALRITLYPSETRQRP
jgi:hypothetical protein